MLRTKEKSAPRMGIKLTMLTRIKPRIIAKRGAGCFFPKALERLSPKK